MSLGHFNIPFSIQGPDCENILKSFKICTFSSPRNVYDYDKIMCIKHDSSNELLEHHYCLEDIDIDPLEGTPEDEVSQKESKCKTSIPLLETSRVT